MGKQIMKLRAYTRRRLPIWVTVVLPLTGCMPPPSPAVSDGTILTYLEDPSTQTSIHYVGLDDRIVLVLWTDITGSSDSRSTSSGASVNLHGKSISEDGREIVWEGNASADGTGMLKIGGTNYDLTNGFVFLVSTKDGTSRARQLSRERVAVSNIRDTIRELAVEKEVTEFFSE